MTKNNYLHESWLFVFQSAPSEGGLTADGLDLCLVASSFDFDFKLLFVGNGLLHIVKPMIIEAQELPSPHYTKTFKALADFDIDQCFVLEPSLHDLHLTNDDLTIKCEAIHAKEMRVLLNSATQVFNF